MTTFKKIISRFTPFALSVLVLAPVVAFADNNFVPLTNLPGIADAGGAPSLPYFLNNLYKICIGAAAVIAVLQIMRAGVLLMTNTGSISHNEQAKDLMRNSVLGLVLVLSPAIVFGIINPKILNLDLDVSGLKSDSLNQVNTDGTITQGNTVVLSGATAVADCKAKGGKVMSEDTTQNSISCSLPANTCALFSTGTDITPLVGAVQEACCAKQDGCKVNSKIPKQTYCECASPTN